MKREIKFRAWDRIDKTMYNIREIDFLANAEINSIRLVVAVQTSNEDIDFDFPIRRDGEYELMQFTGLKDKNGKEIYESDIVKIHAGHPDHLNVVFVVIFETGAFQLLRNNDASGAPVAFITYAMQYNKHNEWSLNEPEDIGQFCEVLGNIYENPELIPVKS